MKELCLFIALMCALSSLSHAQLQLNASMDGERPLTHPGLGLLTNTSNSDLYNPAKSSEYDVLAHQKRAMNVLLGWSGASIITGSIMLFHESRTIRDFGIQNIAWGAIDGGIALYARRSISHKRSSEIPIQEEKENFRKLLLINSLLDVAYVSVGITMAASGRDGLKGHGYGIIAQGAFLLLFDGINLLLIPQT